MHVFSNGFKKESSGNNKPYGIQLSNLFPFIICQGDFMTIKLCPSFSDYHFRLHLKSSGSGELPTRKATLILHTLEKK
jgi:hypothetical protein